MSSNLGIRTLALNFWVSIFQALVIFSVPIYAFKSTSYPTLTTIWFTAITIVELFNFYSCAYKMYFRHYITFTLALISYFGLFWALTPAFDVVVFTWTIIL